MSGKRVEQFSPDSFDDFYHNPTKLSFYTACKTSFRRAYGLFRSIANMVQVFAGNSRLSCRV